MRYIWRLYINSTCIVFISKATNLFHLKSLKIYHQALTKTTLYIGDLNLTSECQFFFVFGKLPSHIYYFLFWQTDVVVNSTSQKLNLTDGLGSKALFKAAGDQIQSEISAKYPDGVVCGELAISGGHNLYCALVFHCFLKRWTEGDKDNAEKVNNHSCIDCRSRCFRMINLARQNVDSRYLLVLCVFRLRLNCFIHQFHSKNAWAKVLQFHIDI